MNKSENNKEIISTAEKLHPWKKHDRLPPEDKPGALKKQGQNLLEDYDHINLREFEEGEAEPGDLEWTRYADQQGPQLPESKIDLDLIPASVKGLRKILIDLQRAETFNHLGEIHLGKNRINQAVRDFSHALEINPDYVDALANRGRAYTLLNNFNDALRDFNYALEINCKQAEIYNLRGEIYLENKLYDQAIRDFTTAINLSPMYSDAYLNRARIYSEKKMEKEAKSDFIQAIRTDPDKFSCYVDVTELESLLDE